MNRVKGADIPLDARILVCGHTGLVGSAIWKALSDAGFQNLFGMSSREVDLTSRSETINAVREVSPHAVFLAAARVGGIFANSNNPVDFLQDNLRIQSNVLEAAHQSGAERLLFLGSSCVYPKFSQQPIKEEYLLNGDLEETNEAYAISKIAGILLVKSYRKQYGKKWISAMPTNLYGSEDNFDTNTGHVLPSLISKFHHAQKSQLDSVLLWGDGSPLREFLHVKDLAAACLLVIKDYDSDQPINIGSGQEVSILRLAEMVKSVSNFQGEIIWDSSKPNGTPRKLLDSSKILKLGWMPKVSLEDGIKSVYEAYEFSFPS